MTTFPFTTCQECAYRRIERAGIHEFQGGATREEAERRAAGEEFCEAHRPAPVQAELISDSVQSAPKHHDLSPGAIIRGPALAERIRKMREAIA